MTITEIEAFVEKKPFVPFSINLNDGKSYPVTHPEFIYIIDRINKIILVSPSNTMYALIDTDFISSIISPAPADNTFR